MAYHNVHIDCNKTECDTRSAYIRLDKRWVKVGHYSTGCKSFDPTDQNQKEQQSEFEKIME